MSCWFEYRIILSNIETLILRKWVYEERNRITKTYSFTWAKIIIVRKGILGSMN